VADPDGLSRARVRLRAVWLEHRGVDEFAVGGVCIACAGEDGGEGVWGKRDVEESGAADFAVV
jgi:hypothetical protein